MSNQAQELFCAIFMDELSHIVGIEKIVAGSAKEFTGSNHELFKRCLLHNATRMILCHNHVTRNAQPSFEDLELTWNIIEVRRNTPSFSEATEKPLVQWTLHFLKFFQENTYKILSDNSAYK